MATLILDRSNLTLATDGAAIAIYEPEGRRGSVPIKLIERVILQGNIALDTGVLTRLAEAGIATLMLSRRQSRRVATVLGPAHNDAAIRIAQCQHAMDDAWRVAWAQRLVTHKTRAQIRLLTQALAQRPDCRKPLFDATGRLENTLLALDEHFDLTTESLRGIEGAAASTYFQALTALFPQSLNFTGRNRRPPRDPVNACLSLGYTLLHFDAVRAAHMAGLDPLIGFYHRPAYGRESLASDLIEPLRPRVDAWVWSLFRNRTLRAEHFGHDQAACLLGKAGREAFYQDYERMAQPLRRALRRQCAALARFLKQRGEPWCDTQGEEDDA